MHPAPARSLQHFKTIRYDDNAVPSERWAGLSSIWEKRYLKYLLNNFQTECCFANVCMVNALREPHDLICGCPHFKVPQYLRHLGEVFHKCITSSYASGPNFYYSSLFRRVSSDWTLIYLWLPCPAFEAIVPIGGRADRRSSSHIETN